jgi:hypothetical protein
MMAERRCVPVQRRRFFDPERLRPSTNLVKYLENAGADRWTPNSNKPTAFALPVQSRRSQSAQDKEDMHPVWGITVIVPR